MEAAVQSLKKGKSEGVDKIAAVLVQAGEGDVITALPTIYNKIWQTGEWPTPWTQSLVITLPKKGDLQQCQNYQTISLIGHPSKVMLKNKLSKLKPQAEIITEEQAGFRADRSTTEQIFNLQILCEKYIQHQHDIYHVFIDFKKSFGMQLCGQPFWVVINGPRYLKLVTVSSFCPFTLISVLIPLVLFVTSLVFSALISMP